MSTFEQCTDYVLRNTAHITCYILPNIANKNKSERILVSSAEVFAVLLQTGNNLFKIKTRNLCIAYVNSLPQNVAKIESCRQPNPLKFVQFHKQ